ncbi:hypothetical protein B0F90DRAFT_30335 [Multifurca ochricompacta]|uniref:Copper acquisition factor BIM1-like domain-containing protein n=1 Tax=Multifurca ochricompacta TaxID=376703 RepID=A0AAD4MC15_9AGAM|nr:hypothetical protein B0F90DRAFT_30335 [Multifurca ochricompacta]
MHFTTLTLLSSLIATVNAHFQLSYPPPRGPFVDDSEVNFCDNYVHAVSNRSEFPLSGGVVTLNSEHTSWSLGILLSIVQDPTSFSNFTTSSGQQQLARNFASGSGEGQFCIPLDLSSTGISGVQNGANVTIQLVFNGGDGSLYQCADLTLSNSFTIPSSVSCSNGTSSSSSPSATSPSGPQSASKTSSTASTKTGNSASGIAITGFAGGFGLLLAALIATL